MLTYLHVEGFNFLSGFAAGIEFLGDLSGDQGPVISDAVAETCRRDGEPNDVFDGLGRFLSDRALVRDAI
jgi:hypothetical protein